MVLQSAMGFDPQNLNWKVRVQQAKESGEIKLDPSIIKDHLGSSMYTDHIQFVKGLHQLTRSDRTVMTLMFVIEFFSPDRANLENTDSVKQTHDKFKRWLQQYLESTMPVVEAERLYPELLKKFLEVKSIGEASAKLASNLDISKLKPLLIEVFNLKK
ncbi:uncharacterized protein LOC127831083 [Dreissena polymorpha]|uniref:NR LBD domain-containing protein n=1 Tax=Dreissena polymorpha TaxID=45954 RepID=A0A9D4GM19_DREPO|nr:uncharacterized protein LOC127831083 [Dreissena polymorpha]KAH3818023.1 hypothetical protein DPMN_119610 [Dreissena polymorpha]